MGAQGKKLRCRHCHLTIDEEELGSGFCPECREVYGLQRRDFDVVETEDRETTLYRCENCGAVIRVD